MAPLKYWLWLTTRTGLGSLARRRVVEHFGTPETAFFADEEEYALSGCSTAEARALSDKSMDLPERILEDCERLGVRIVTLRDAVYPDRLRHIFDPPVLLYTRGRFPLFDEEVAIAAVGSRDASAYGILTAQRFSYQLASQGALVLSGLARGIDTAAMEGALKAGGAVAGILGGGIDVVYPRENQYLYEDVAAAGVLISEYPPGTEPSGAHFPVRNRIMSGLSLGVLVVEAAERSGALITARHALEQGRDVFAVPGNVDAPNSAGANRLIRDGSAALVLSGADVLREYSALYPHKMKAYGKSLPPDAEGPAGARAENAALLDGKKAAPEKEVDKKTGKGYIDLHDPALVLSDDEKDVLYALGRRILHVDEVIELTQVPARRVLSALTVLEMRDLVCQHEGKRFESLVVIKEE